MHIFMGARQVVEALRRHDCREALAWCEENRAKLKKAKSKLEFRVRVQVRRRQGVGCWGHGRACVRRASRPAGAALGTATQAAEHA